MSEELRIDKRDINLYGSINQSDYSTTHLNTEKVSVNVVNLGSLSEVDVETLRVDLGIEPAKEEEKPKMGGGLRYNSGKAELHQVPTSLSFAVAKTLQFGQQKYHKANWRQGMSWMTVYDCLDRHMKKWLDNESVDEESLLPHLYHAACNIAFLIEYMETYPEGDDRFKGKINHAADSFDKHKFNEYKK